jgi:hypothetical protein
MLPVIKFYLLVQLFQPSIHLFLEATNIARNKKIPQEIGNLLLIQKLSTFRNNLSGSIHPQISDLSELNRLDLNQTVFMGLKLLP